MSRLKHIDRPQLYWRLMTEARDSILLEALERCGNKRGAAAQYLGLNRTQFLDLLAETQSRKSVPAAPKPFKNSAAWALHGL